MATAQDVIDRTRNMINDVASSFVDGLMWSDAELMRWITDGQREIVTLEPEAHIVTDWFEVAGGVARQALDSEVAHRLIRVEANGTGEPDAPPLVAYPVVYYPASKDAFSVTAATSMQVTLSNANVDPITDSAPDAVVFVQVSVGRTDLSAFTQPTITIDGVTAEFTAYIANTALGFDSIQYVAAFRIPDGGFTSGIVTIAWASLLTSGTTVRVSANTFYNVGDIGGATGTQFVTGTEAASVGPLTVLDGGAVFVTNMQHTGGDVDAIVQSVSDEVNYTMQTPDVLTSIMYYMTGYKLFATGTSESIEPADDAYVFRPIIAIAIDPAYR